jgi:DNA-binding Lrp family transcriptional regulator
MSKHQGKTVVVPGLTISDILSELSADIIDPADGWERLQDIAEKQRLHRTSARGRLDKLVENGKLERAVGRLEGENRSHTWYRVKRDS